MKCADWRAPGQWWAPESGFQQRRRISMGVLTYCSGPETHFPQPTHTLLFQSHSEHTSELLWVICLRMPCFLSFTLKRTACVQWSQCLWLHYFKATFWASVQIPWSICVLMLMFGNIRLWVILTKLYTAMNVPPLSSERPFEHPSGVQCLKRCFYCKQHLLHINFPVGRMDHRQLVRSLCAMIYYSLAHWASVIAACSSSGCIWWSTNE